MGQGNMTKQNAERIFGFDQEYTFVDFNKRYRELVGDNHPDVGGDPAAMVEINQARDVLRKLFKDNKDAVIEVGDSDEQPVSETTVGVSYAPWSEEDIKAAGEEARRRYQKERDDIDEMFANAARREEEEKERIAAEEAARKAAERAEYKAKYPAWYRFLEFVIAIIPLRLLFVIGSATYLVNGEGSSMQAIIAALIFLVSLANAFLGGFLTEGLRTLALLLLQGIYKPKE